ncbi:uncharacterized protein LOC110108662 [Dendrobium catenatum]|uniref:uncharacterized protein LOC110108662 n=1 Tax=Dendrobium catenatum TaxID=906689 RepID=UPI0009F32D40|nr:uncharacterized protein LOC110108662 [Dendrobium catenatum]
MEEIPEISVLDYVIFNVSALDNSYEALICSNDIIENLTCGPLDQLAVHLPEARSSPSHGSFKLQLDESIETSLWFNKFTVARFLHIVNVPNMLNLANTIENEISQLEETRKFHIALYAKGHLLNSAGRTDDISCLNDLDRTRQVEVETVSSDATKNELLRALDLRLAALKEELTSAFNRASGATCFSNQISDLASFAQHFGATELRKSLLKFFELCPNMMPIEPLLHHQTSLNDSVNNNQMETKTFWSLDEETDVKFATTNVFPAKVAPAERESSSESEDSTNSSHANNPSTERSRHVVRSATPRRSASPMRRIQIGRSGSRRSTTLTIKSLNYLQSRETPISSNRDADVMENGDEELEHLPKKPDNNVGRMSVQDAINLFESKQKVPNSDVKKSKTLEVSIGANKSILRRWSSGMGNSFICSTEEQPSNSCQQVAQSKLYTEAEENMENNMKDDLSNPENAPIVGMPGEIARIVETTVSEGIIPSETVVSMECVDRKDQPSTADWNRQKEEELNEMLTKMMSSNSDMKVGNDMLKDESIDQRGGFYSQYNEKRNQKLRNENARNHATRETQFKLMTHETLEKSKAAMTSKPTGSAVKREFRHLSQNPRRNSSPPVLSKKEVSKPTNTRKASSNSSSQHTQRSFPSGSLKKLVGTLPAKSSPVVSSTPSCQKSQPSSSPARPSPRTKKPLQHMKSYNSASIVQDDIKPILFGQEHKIVKVVKKNSINVKSRSPLSGENCGSLPSKPSVQSKNTRKSSVVPLESKPFLRKGSGIISVNGHSVAKTKGTRISNSSDSLKSIEKPVLHEELESNPSPAGSAIKVIGYDLAQPANVVDETLAAPLGNDDGNIETTEIVDGSLTRVDNEVKNPVEPVIAVNHQEEDLGISSAAWVDAESQEYSPSYNNRHHHVVISPLIVPVASSSPRVRHSLSQMLQADSTELEIIEWGNAENPPSLVYQKDVPKGLKRLLNFARKSKGELNLSPSVFSEGDEEHEESKAAIKRSSDAPLWKTSLQAQGYGQPKRIGSESLDLGKSIKKTMEHRGVRDDLSGSEKLRNGHLSAGVTATRATRSFFSLSSFRSGKSN